MSYNYGCSSLVIASLPCPVASLVLLLTSGQVLQQTLTLPLGYLLGPQMDPPPCPLIFRFLQHLLLSQTIHNLFRTMSQAIQSNPDGWSACILSTVLRINMHACMHAGALLDYKNIHGSFASYSYIAI